MGSSKEASGMAPSPSVPTIRVPGVVLNIGLAPGGLPSRRSGIVTEGLRAFVLRPLSVMSSKPVQRYSCKLRGSRFLKMDDSLIVEVVSSFSAPPISSGAGKELVGPSSELVDSEEEDEDFWGVEDGDCWGGDGEDGDFPYPLGDFPPPPVWTGF
jgi:hypothetical protein